MHGEEFRKRQKKLKMEGKIHDHNKQTQANQLEEN